jgi:hypothetical protein
MGDWESAFFSYPLGRCIAAMVFFSVLIGAGIEPAHSETATFKLTNAAPYTIAVKLFSQTRRGWQWPSTSRNWVLDDSRQHTLSAQIGESK